MTSQISSDDNPSEESKSETPILGLSPILCGIETEYGFSIEGRGAEDQIDDAIQFVRSYAQPHFSGWNYAYESPRADLRGFKLDTLATDPVDAEFDAGKNHGQVHDIRSDKVLPNGARFYNDHGHPEYATPECWQLAELALHDKAGEIVLRRAAFELETQIEKPVTVYKNNTDFHGASYGTHENYLVPRNFGFQQIYDAVLPVLIARQVLTGAGKVGSEKGPGAIYQISARSDFFVEAANAETLFRRPIFNTRDECHADPQKWIRLHVISGDANMIPSCTSRKVGLVKLALHLLMLGRCPKWKIENPVQAFQDISRDESNKYRINLSSQNWTNAYELLESYFAEFDQCDDLHDSPAGGELCQLVSESRTLLKDLSGGSPNAAKHIDWLAKRKMLETYMEDSGTDWNDPSLQAFDLEYHNIDPDAGLHFALAQMGEIENYPPQDQCLDRLIQPHERNRAWARSIALSKFPDKIENVCWRTISIRNSQEEVVQIELAPDREYPLQLEDASNVENYIQWVNQ